MPIDSIENKLTSTLKAPIESIDSPAPNFWSSSYVSTSGPTFVPVPKTALSPISTIARYIDKDLQRANKYALESFY